MSGHRLTSKDEHFYAVTKNGVRILTEGLRRELREVKSHIRVTVSYTSQSEKHRQLNHIYGAAHSARWRCYGNCTHSNAAIFLALVSRTFCSYR